MEIIELLLIMVFGALLSSIVSQIVSKVAAPIIQILIGLIITLFYVPPADMIFDSELFMTFFIAPILFNEAKNIDKLMFWKNKAMIFSLAIGLVIATVISVGLATHMLIPSISIAAAMALGAALGPTDAVAVSSMSKSVSISERHESILSGECLINDASGIVAFQFAITLALSGTFSPTEAAGTFLIMFFGGIVLGVVIGYISNISMAFIRNHGLENMRFHVLFEFALPFLSFILGESIGVSGILAVVGCGIIFNVGGRDITAPSIAKMNIVSTSVWDLVVFALNGMVFVLLGLQIPASISGILANEHFSELYLILCAVTITVIVLTVRFVWTLLIETITSNKHAAPEKGRFRRRAKNCLILTVSGAKGAITLTMALTLPAGIGSREPIIFLAVVSIILTLIIANIVLPIVVPTSKQDESQREKMAESKIDILRNVIGKVSNTAPEGDIATRNVIQNYNARIEKLKEGMSSVDDKELENKAYQLRVKALTWEEEKAALMIESKEVSEESGYRYIYHIDNAISRIQNKNEIFRAMSRSARKMKILWKSILFFLRDNWFGKDLSEEDLSEKDILKSECAKYVLKNLKSMLTSGEWEKYERENISELYMEYEKVVRAILAKNPSITQIARATNETDELMMKALRYELDFIQDAYDDKQIDRATMAQMKRNVYIMQFGKEGI